MKLEYSEIEKNRKLNTIVEIICAAILGCACFYVFISMFRLNYSTGTMFSGGFGKGIAGVWDGIADTLGSVNYTILPKYAATTGSEAAKGYGMALTVILAMFAVLSYLVIKSRIRPLLLIFVIPVIMLICGFGVTPSAYAGALFGAALIIALTVMSIKGKMKPEYFILALAAVLVSIIVVTAIDKNVSLDEPKSMAESGAAARTSIDRMRYGTDALPAGEVGKVSGKDLKESRGDIDSIKAALQSVGDEKDEDSKTALTVSMSQPQSYYLRGFVGAEYNKNKWNTLPNGVFYSMRDEVFWLNRRGFDGLSEMSYASELTGQAPENVKIEVTVKDASKKIAFTPYELVLKPASGDKARKSEMKLPKGTKNYGGSYLGTEGYTGKSSYKYTAAPNITGVWTDAVGKFYTAFTSEEINSFFISESHYNVDVYDKYLDVPSTLLDVFNSEIGSPGDISEEHADYKETIETISTYLTDKFIYSEAFSPIKKDKDFVQSFIDSKKGSDIHFATLAALLFRYYGIPARYVEGYLITPTQVAGKTGETIVNVSKSANHAWTEIYIDGFGWVPFEATPEYRGIMQEADMTKGLQNVDYENPNNRNNDTEDDNTEDEENEENNDLTRLLLVILIVFLIAIIAVLLLILIVLIVRMLLKWLKWRKAFKDADPKAGIRALYQYTKEKKWELSEEGENLGLVASYSTYKMEESDRTKMLSEVDAAKERAKKEQAAARAKAKAEKEAAKAKAKAEQESAKAKAKAEQDAAKQEKKEEKHDEKKDADNK